MKECQTCQVFKETKGVGTKQCKSCKWYKKFKMQFTPRNKIVFEDISQQIMESLPDQIQANSILDHVRRLPADKAIPLMMQFVLNMTLQEIADELHMSRQAVDKKNKLSIKIIREMLIDG